jgi:thiol-disulfide isomerase/thioredoxin
MKDKFPRTLAALLSVFVLGFAASCGGGDQGSDGSGGSRGDTGAVVYPPAPASIMEPELTAVDGSKFSLSGRKGKVLLVNLWATWCGPCIEEMPDLVKMQEELGPKGFEVIGINTETNEGFTVEELKPKIDDFIVEHRLNYPNAFIVEGMFDEFVKLSKLPAIPQSIVVDREGRLRGVFTGGGAKNVAKMRETAEKVVLE